jgi:chromosome partitioning protein
MRTLAVSLQKGGVGKTSLSVSLAAELAALSGATLLLDADPQGNASAWIGEETIDAELADVLLERASLEKAIVKTGATGLFLLPKADLEETLKPFRKAKQRMIPFVCGDLSKKPPPWVTPTP